MRIPTKGEFMTNQAIYGILSTRAQAEKAIKEIVDAGVSKADISFLSPQNENFHEFDNLSGVRNWRTEERLPNSSEQTASEKTKESTPGNLGHEKNTKAPEGATTGATAGGIAGGILGLLAGIGALAIPGAGPFIAAGPIMAALSGLGAGGTIGGIIGALVGGGIPEYEAKRYENRLKSGGILLAVRANSDDLVKRVKEIMKQNSAEDITASSEASST
jgi:hypothetical protein